MDVGEWQRECTNRTDDDNNLSLLSALHRCCWRHSRIDYRGKSDSAKHTHTHTRSLAPTVSDSIGRPRSRRFWISFGTAYILWCHNRPPLVRHDLYVERVVVAVWSKGSQSTVGWACRRGWDENARPWRHRNSSIVVRVHMYIYIYIYIYVCMGFG